MVHGGLRAQRVHVRKVRKHEQKNAIVAPENFEEGAKEGAGPPLVSSNCSLDGREKSCLFSKFVNKG